MHLDPDKVGMESILASYEAPIKEAPGFAEAFNQARHSVFSTRRAEQGHRRLHPRGAPESFSLRARSAAWRSAT